MERDDPAVYYNCACVYRSLGKVDEAIKFLKKAISSGFSHKAWIEKDPELALLKDHSEYQIILDSISL